MAVDASPPASEPTQARTARGAFRSLPEASALIVFLIAESVFFSIKSPYFLAWDNWLNILTAVAVIGIVAAPGTLLMTAGQFDLSVGSTVAFTSVDHRLLGGEPRHRLLAAGRLRAGLLVGVINGFLVTVSRSTP